MKKYNLSLVILCLTISAAFSQASSYTNFEWDVVRIGFASPVSSDSLNKGINLGGEVRFNFRDDISIGLAADFVYFAETLGDSGNANIDFAGANSLTVDKYFGTTSSKRFFAGTGLGYYRNSEIKTRKGFDNIKTDKFSSVGISPRIGYELGHLRIMAQYHYTTKSEMYDFFTINLAITLWGGYKGS